MKEIKPKYFISKNLIIFSFLFIILFNFFPINNNFSFQSKPISNTPHYWCGNLSGDSAVSTSINFGCSGRGNGILDLTFAIIRFLSDGVGIVVVLSLIIAGIQYITSSGEPQAVNKAVSRIRSSLIALIIYIFAYAIIDYIVPGFILK